MATASVELTRAIREAEDIARSSGQTLSTAHLLLALFTFPNRAQLLLKERRIDEDVILAHMLELPSEPAHAFKRLRERALELAEGSGAREADCLHLLVALLRVRESLAYELLSRTGVPLTSLRNVVVSYVTNNLPRRFLQVHKAEPFAPSELTLAKEQVQKERGLRDLYAKDEELPRLASARRSRPTGADLVDEANEETFDVALDLPRPPAVRSVPALKSVPKPAPDKSEQSSYLLDPAEFPLLSQLGRNLCADAEAGRVDDLIGRAKELSQMIDVLGRRRANNACLVGPPGVGKTALVEGLALAIVRGGDDMKGLTDKIIVDVPVGALVAGTSLRGALSEKLAQLQLEVKQANGRVIVFIDELHTLIGAGNSGDGAQDVANELKAALARGEFPCIGATTDAEYKKYVEADPAMERRFTPIEVKEPSVDEAVLMLEGGIAAYAEHHGVTYSVDALQAACAWSHKFIAERKLPDKAFSIADLAGSRARRSGRAFVERSDIAEIVAELAGLPPGRLKEGENDRLSRAEQELAKHFVGHEDAVKRVATALRRGFAGFARHRPVGSFLFLGPTGVGKTELAKAIAEFLFGRKDALIRVDLSEFVEPHSLARLVGAPPGYVGFDQGGQLTEAIRKRPFQVILFDEFEKAHPEVRNVLLQILDEGRLTDGRGRTVRFTDCVIVLTSNAGAQAGKRASRRLGFDSAAPSGSGTRSESDAITADEMTLAEAKLSFTPELWNRIDEKVVFRPLSESAICQIARLMLDDLVQGVFAEREITLTYTEEAVHWLADKGFDAELGARPLRQTVQREVEGPLAQQVVSGDVGNGSRIVLDVNDDGLLEFFAEESEDDLLDDGHTQHP